MTEKTLFPEPLDRSFLLDPFPFYARMRRESPVAAGAEGGAFVAFSFETAQRVLSDYETFSSRVPFPPEMKDGAQSPIFMDPPKHKSVRAIVQQSFTRKRVEDMEPRIAELVHDLIDAIEGRRGTEVDFVSAFAAPLPTTVIAEIMGVPVEDMKDFRRWSDGIIVGDQTATRELASYFRRLIEERQGVSRGDLIGDLLAAHEADGTALSEQELVDFCILLLVGGNETTTSLLSSIVRCLDTHPEARERLHADHSLVSSTIEETLRYRSPVQAQRRFTLTEVELGGMRVNRGQGIYAHIGSANRDETRFENPEVFQIDRNPNRHVAFGQGVHFCLGAPLARLEAKVALTVLLERLPELHIGGDTQLEPIPTWMHHGVTALPVVF